MAERTGFSVKTLRAIALVLLAGKLALLILVRPFMDEAYYSMWGQHLALSYFDHPPLIGWTQGLSAAIFGWNQLGLRAPLVLTLACDVALLYLFARRLGADDWQRMFWLTLALFCSSPVFSALTTIGLPDHLLIVTLLAALYCFHGYFIALERDEKALRLLYLGAFALGLAFLSKYYAVLFGVGLVLFVLLNARARVALRSPHIYLAALVTIVLQAPVLIWNIQHDFASFAFILGGRRPLGNPLSFSGTIGYVLGIIAIVSPFLMWPMARFALSPEAGPSRLPRTVFWVSTLAFLVASVFTNILIHWNLVAYIAMLAFLAPWIRSRWLLAGHFVYGALAILVLGFNYAVMPIVSFAGPKASDQTSAWSYGWDEVAFAVRQASDEQHPAFIATTDYTLAGQLGLVLQDRDVTSLSPRVEAFDFWFDAKAMEGKDAILVADRWRKLSDNVESQFSSVEQLKQVEITRFGFPVDTYTIYLAKGFSASSQP